MKVRPEIIKDNKTILNISVFKSDDLQFLLKKDKFKEKIIHIIENITLPDELFIKIKVFEENNILTMVY